MIWQCRYIWDKHTWTRGLGGGLRGGIQSADIQIDVDENHIDLDCKKYLLCAQINTKSVHSLHALGSHGNGNGTGIGALTQDELGSDAGDEYTRYDKIMDKYNKKYFENDSFSNSDSNSTIDTSDSESESKSNSSNITDDISERISYTAENENDNNEDGDSSLDSNLSGNDNCDRSVSDSDDENSSDIDSGYSMNQIGHKKT